MILKVFLVSLCSFTFPTILLAQVNWQNVDNDFAPLPSSLHIYRTTDPIEGKANIAYYIEADLTAGDLSFGTDTTLGRRLTPSQFLEKNKDASTTTPLVIVNTTFFSFDTNQNLNTVVRNKKLVSYNIHSFPGRGKDTLTYRHAFASALGIKKNGSVDVAWLLTDSSKRFPYAMQKSYPVFRDSIVNWDLRSIRKKLKNDGYDPRKWKVQTAVGGGPVLIQNGLVHITNNEEYRFAGKAIDDRHPRTAMGYTKDRKLIILVVEGRNPGIAEGASLKHLAELLKEIGCVEALNLDGGGSSCMIVNGKNTIKPSDKNALQRPVPAVFIISKK